VSDRRPGPVGTGPFVLAEGFSSLDAEQATISTEPSACTWLWHQDRTPRVRLVADPGYWDRRRGPRLREADAERVERSEHARLVSVDAMRALVGIIDRDADGLPLGDRRARQALNLAVDRAALVRGAMSGRARPLAGLTPPTALTLLHRLGSRLTPYPHDPALAARLWRAAGGTGAGALRLAAPGRFERVARQVAGDLRAALGLQVEVLVHGDEEQRDARRALAERRRPRAWDVLLLEQATQSADAPPHELHRAFVGASGEYRAGPAVPEFEALYGELVGHTSQLRLVQLSNRLDRFVREQALALFLCAPDALYAVNRHVEFKPYHTTFELAETRVDDEALVAPLRARPRRSGSPARRVPRWSGPRRARARPRLPRRHRALSRAALLAGAATRAPRPRYPATRHRSTR
jgi:hypothetical protein